MYKNDTQQSGEQWTSISVNLTSHNFQFGAQEAYTHPAIVSQVATSLNTPHLQTRKAVADVLIFFIYERDFQAFPLVINALETLSTANNEAATPYAYWFKSMEQFLSGRGVMGSLVGASDEIRRAGGPDSSMNDYAVCAPVLEAPVRLFTNF